MRHRLGTPGLRHSRELCRPASRRRQRHLVPAVVTMVLGVLAIGSWLAVDGATAFAEMISP